MTHVEFIGLLTKASLTDDPNILVSIQEAIEEGAVDFTKYIGDTLALAGELEQTMTGIDAEIKRLEQLKYEREVRAKKLHSLVQWTLEQVGQTEWFNDLHTVRLKRNPPKVVIDSEASIPREWWREEAKVEVKLDRKGIAEALKNGVPVEGCRLVQEWRMEIK